VQHGKGVYVGGSGVPQYGEWKDGARIRLVTDAEEAEAMAQELDQLARMAEPVTESDEESEEELEVFEPGLRGGTRKRQGVSAEVYGQFNKKGDFQPRVVEKSEETKDKLR
jgi:hypothetical protein